MDVAAILEEYKTVSLELIDNIKNNMDVEGLMGKRNTLLKELNNSSASQEKKRNLVEKLGILKVEDTLNISIEEAQRQVKDELLDIRRRKSANKGYGLNKDGISIFDKEI